MITPGFFGFFNAHRSLLAAQTAMNTVNQNISNANTEGYSRQRVETTTFNPYSDPSVQMISTSGQIGQGPWVTSVTRSRDQFLDAQYRQANSFLGQNSTVRTVLNQIEGILAEPSESGINTAMQNFFDIAQQLSVNPDSIAVRSQFMQQAADLVTVFQQQGQQLVDLRKNLVGDPLDPSTFGVSQLAITAGQVNSKLEAIVKLNQSIVTVKASGAQPNDLLDQRDKLLDDLSKLVDINVKSYDNGQIDVSIGGQTMIKGVDQTDSLQVVQNTGTTPTPDDVPALIRTVNGGAVLNDGTGDEITSGTLKAFSDMGGNSSILTTPRGVLGKLDTLMNTVVTQVNNLQTTGRDLNGNLGTANPIFQADATLNPGEPLALFHWKVNNAIVNNPSLLAAAKDDTTVTGGFAGVGDGRNALALAKLRDTSFGTLGASVVNYLSGIISKLGIDTSSYKNGASSQDALVKSINQQRQSVSGVNMDEETIDLLRYQRAYEASSKVISTLDEMMKTIINMV